MVFSCFLPCAGSYGMLSMRVRAPASEGQLSLALAHSTSASLVLLDEFGKGTRTSDGVALLAASVEQLCRSAEGPRALVATHFTEIFRLKLVAEEEPRLRLSHMRVLQAEGQGLAYLYQLVPGCGLKSLGIECARKAGLQEEVLRRAEEVLEQLEAKAHQVPRRGWGRRSPGFLTVLDRSSMVLGGFC